jgi:MarR family transcriptional regulator for hemolysin
VRLRAVGILDVHVGEDVKIYGALETERLICYRFIYHPKEALVFDSSWSACRLMSRAQRLFAKDADHRLKPLGLSPGYIPVILALAVEAALTQKALVQHAAIEQPTMAGTLSRMERDGLVERRGDRTDVRGSLFSLTRLAKSKLPQFFEQLSKGNAVALVGLTADEGRQLVDTLTKDIYNLGGKLPKKNAASGGKHANHLPERSRGMTCICVARVLEPGNCCQRCGPGYGLSACRRLRLDCGSGEFTARGPLPSPGSGLQQPNILGYVLVLCITTYYIRCVLPLFSIGEQIATKRKALGLTQPVLAKKARIGLSTLDALENGRLGELGYSKITNILSALGLELKLQEASARRPTLDELIEEERDDKGLDRRR